MGLSQSQDQSRGFDKLSRVKSGHFYFFIKLSRSNDPELEVWWIDSSYFSVLFLIDLFFNLIL